LQGKLSEADTPTIQVGVTPSGLISDPPPSSAILTPDAIPGATLPIYPGLEQAANRPVLACLPVAMKQWNDQQAARVPAGYRGSYGRFTLERTLSNYRY